MDENKEFLTEEAAPEALSDADTKDYDLDAFDEDFSQPEEALQEEEPQNSVAEPADVSAAPKKKRTVQFTILLSAAIVLVVLLAAVVCRLFFFQGVVNTGLFGTKTTTWHYQAKPVAGASADEATSPDFYFIYEPDGRLKVELGSFEYQGAYTIRKLEQKDVADLENGDSLVGKPVLNIENSGIIDGKFLFERTGNAFTDSTLLLTSVENDTVKLNFDAREYVPAQFEREGEFHKDDAIVGEWTYKNEVGEQTFVFEDNGSYSLKTMANNVIQSQHGIYDCQNGQLTIYYQYLNDQAQTFKYTIADNKLTLTMVMEFMGQTYEQPAGEFTKVTK